MVVSERDYDKCISTHPTFFSNNGNTMFAFNQSGDYYFISGISGHCQRGQKMIIKVLGHSVPSTSPPAGGNGTRPINPPSPSGAAAARGGGASFLVVVVLQLVVVFVGSLFY
ncbi:Early nodulin-like protein 1 [Acorus calamus]|uniref:Early nodulin-like protein 1 n=1 Tax=Acorus calamus TaxID=4465 RepID=A0AAV9D0A5_ACOCL|nr:Early nodulin-like protein 1 [Acorus calamus]